MIDDGDRDDVGLGDHRLDGVTGRFDIEQRQRIDQSVGGDQGEPGGAVLELVVEGGGEGMGAGIPRLGHRRLVLQDQGHGDGRHRRRHQKHDPGEVAMVEPQPQLVSPAGQLVSATSRRAASTPAAASPVSSSYLVTFLALSAAMPAGSVSAVEEGLLDLLLQQRRQAGSHDHERARQRCAAVEDLEIVLELGRHVFRLFPVDVAEGAGLDQPAMDPDHEVVLRSGEHVADRARRWRLLRRFEFAQLQAGGHQLRLRHEVGGCRSGALERQCAADEVGQAVDRRVLPLEQDAPVVRGTVAPLAQQQLGTCPAAVGQRRKHRVERDVHLTVAQQVRHLLGAADEPDASFADPGAGKAAGQIVPQRLERGIVLARIVADPADDQHALPLAGRGGGRAMLHGG